MTGMKDYLKRCLSETEFARMCELTVNWTVNPFEYYSESDTIELSDQWLSSHDALKEQDLELLLRVCELLKDTPFHLFLPVHVDPVPQKATRKFIFQQGENLSDLSAAKRFCQLLQERPGYKVDVKQKDEMEVVEVSFWYRSELEYVDQVEDIKLLFAMAQWWSNTASNIGLA